MLSAQELAGTSALFDIIHDSIKAFAGNVFLFDRRVGELVWMQAPFQRTCNSP
jgi:hypothetical protein